MNFSRTFSPNRPFADVGTRICMSSTFIDERAGRAGYVVGLEMELACPRENETRGLSFLDPHTRTRHLEKGPRALVGGG